MSHYSMFYEHDVPGDIGNLEKVAEHFEIYVTDKDIWHIAKDYEDPPHLGNVYLEILYARLATKLAQVYPGIEVQFEINALASYFYINGQRLCSLSQLDGIN